MFGFLSKKEEELQQDIELKTTVVSKKSKQAGGMNFIPDKEEKQTLLGKQNNVSAGGGLLDTSTQDPSLNDDTKKPKMMTRDEAKKQNLKLNDKDEDEEIEIKKGDYRVQVHIIEAKDIKSRGKAGGGEDNFMQAFEGEQIDPMIEVDVMGTTKCTEYFVGQVNPKFNQTLFFEFSNMKAWDIESGMITLNLLDHDNLRSNNFLGSFSVDVAYIYRLNKNHEIYRVWVAMTDPQDETQQPYGYVKLSINVLGPGDKPPVHDATKDLVNKNDNGQNELFLPNRLRLEPHALILTVYRAEHLPILNYVSDDISAYVKISFAGSKAETKTVPNNRNPEFNQKLSIAFSRPSMNKKIKIEIWNDNVFTDERVGTYYLELNDDNEANNFGPAWLNFYGPPYKPDGDKEYADLMTNKGHLGSTYRGRLLCSFHVSNQESAKTQTQDIKVDWLSQTGPNVVRTKQYLVQVALYEGLDLPELSTHKEYAIIVACGPYEKSSSIKRYSSGKVEWAEIVDLNFYAPENIEDIPDIILYLASNSDDVSTRICFKRIEAIKFLFKDREGEEVLQTYLDEEGISKDRFRIRKFFLTEDKAYDKLSDEQFPGLIFARIKLFATDPAKDRMTNEIFREYKDKDSYIDYILHVHLYVGKNFPPADETGAADPFVVARCRGKVQKSKTKYQTLNPGFFETLEMQVSLPPQLPQASYDGDIDESYPYPRPGISLQIFDEDFEMFQKKTDFLGRVWLNIVDEGFTAVEVPGKKGVFKNIMKGEKQWKDLIFDATDSRDGDLLISYDLIPLSERNDFKKESIVLYPPSQKCMISIAVIGLRDIVPSIDLIPVTKLFIKFDVNGKSKYPIQTNKRPVINGACNFFEVLTFEIELPKQEFIDDFAPTLTIYVYDTSFGGVSERLIGVANLHLYDVCHEYYDNRESTPQVKVQEVQPSFQTAKSIKPHSFVASLLQRVGEGEVEQEDLNKTINKSALLRKVAKTLSVPDKEKKMIEDSNDEMIKVQRALKDQLDKKAKKESDMKEAYRKQFTEKETSKKRSVIKDLILGYGATKKVAIEKAPKKEAVYSTFRFDDNGNEVKNEEEEEADFYGQVEKPEYMCDREILDDDLENDERIWEEQLPYFIEEFWRGQTRGKQSLFSEKVQDTHVMSGNVKFMVKIKDKPKEEDDQKVALIAIEEEKKTSARALKVEEVKVQKKSQVVKRQEIDEEFKPFMIQKQCVARLYVLEGKSLTPRDMATSDPYLVIKLGDKVIEDKSSMRAKTNDPRFYTSYDLPVQLPGTSSLIIEVWDDDGYLPPDLIGTTEIDLEQRFFSHVWKEMEKKPVEQRTLYIPTSSSPQGILQCWVEIYDPSAGVEVPPKIDITPNPPEEFEVRVIVWGARTNILKDPAELCNDLFVRAVMGKKEYDTDTHWRCRKDASFNWRMKFPLSYPPIDQDDADQNYILELRLFDKDIVKHDEKIGYTELHLHKLDNMIQKAFKKRQKVALKQEQITKTLLGKEEKIFTDKFWVQLTIDESCTIAKDQKKAAEDGKTKEPVEQTAEIEISIEILPKLLSMEYSNGIGREAPNQFPVLTDPKGRFSFNIMSPWNTIKEIVGPEIAAKIRKYFCLAMFLYFCFAWGIYFVGDIVSSLIANYITK